MSGRSCTARAPWSRLRSPCLIRLRSRSSGCGTCFGTATTRRRARPWAGPRARPSTPARCKELRSYVESSEGALIDRGQRHRAGKPISTSRAEGTVNNLVSARMNKRRQMRRSPRGAYRVLQVRAAALDGRFGRPAVQLAAQRPGFLALPPAAGSLDQQSPDHAGRLVGQGHVRRHPQFTRQHARQPLARAADFQARGVRSPPSRGRTDGRAGWCGAAARPRTPQVPSRR